MRQSSYAASRFWARAVIRHPEAVVTHDRQARPHLPESGQRGTQSAGVEGDPRAAVTCEHLDGAVTMSALS